MSSSPPATSTVRWRDPSWLGTASAGFLCALLSAPGQTFVLALYVEPITASLDVSRATAAHWYGAATLLAAFLLVPVGRLADRWSAERFLAAVIISIGVALLVLSQATTAWQVVLAFIILRLAGQGAVGVGVLTLVARRHAVGRGRLLSLSQLGHSAGELVFPSLVLLSIAAVTWRNSTAGMGLLYLAVAAPAMTWLLHRTRPPIAHAARVSRGSAHDVMDLPEGPLVEGPGFREALRMPAFWLASTAFAVPAVVVTALVFHQVALFRWTGWPPALVPVSFGTLAVSQVATTAAAGGVAERWSARRGAGLSALAMMGALVALLLPVPGLVGAMLHGGLLGVGSALSALVGAVVWPTLFGLRALGGIRAASSALRNAATAAGPLVFVVAAPGADLAPALVALAILSLAGGMAGAPLSARPAKG